MGVFTPAMVSALITVVMVWRDPRRLRCGVFLLSTLMLAAFAVLGLALSESDTNVAAYSILILGGLSIVLVLVLAIYLLVSGLVLFHREGLSLSHSLSFALGLLILAYPALFIAFGLADRQWAMIFLFALVFPLVYLSFVLVAYLIYSWLYGVCVRRFYRRYQAVVVLGAGLAGAELTPLLRDRVDRGITALNGGPERLLVLSGGQGPDEELAEGVAMARYAVAQGVAEENVLVEDSSRTTEENLRFTAQLVGPRPLLVVTSDYHAFRAATLMSRMTIVGQALGARTRGYFRAAAVLREYIALLRDNLGLNIVALCFSLLPLLLSLFFYLFQ